MDQELYIKLAAVTRFYQHESGLLHKHRQAETKAEELKKTYQLRKEQGAVSFRFIIRSCYMCILGLLGCILPWLPSYGLSQGEQVLVIFLFGSLLIWGIARLRSVKKRKEKHELAFQKIWRDEFQPQVERQQAIMESVAEEVQNMHKEYDSLLAFLPGKYRNFQATSFMLMAVKDGRADTLKEAYNLYEEQLHRWKLEAAANRAAEMQQLVAMAIDELNSQQAETNAHLSAIEQYEFIKYIHPDQN